MYKMLTRGMKHPVLNLTANNPAINPYVAWMELRSKAKSSVAIDGQGNMMVMLGEVCSIISLSDVMNNYEYCS